ncbi:TPR-like protein [Mycena sanguinolenta]|uniref:TPR-like protein n=1 Tax=Mycena sanguinolenta TaxID=230812 RepID=A0A8H6X406_9AGAR|nr:TPR-like protein [Mycena sanguinolenta]
MSSTDSPDTSASQPSRKSRWNPFKSRASKSNSKPASVRSAGDNSSHEAVNVHISGGQGGGGGVGGLLGGGGGTGEGPTLHYNIKAEQITMNTTNMGSAIFHGRQAILDSMHRFFGQDIRKQKVYVLYGLGGAGKTQIALKFIEEWSQFTDQLFVDASSTNTIETGLTNIALTNQAGTSSQDGLMWLARKHEEWLLFLDNADDPTINLNYWFPKCNHGNIIITSRNHGARIHGAYSEVSNMEESDAVALLLKSALYEFSPTNVQLAAEIVKYTKAEVLKVAMQSLALIYDNMAQFEDAEKLHVVVLEKRKRLLGDDHLDTLHTMYCLAIIYDNLGRFEEAEKLYSLVLEKREKIYGDADLDVMYNLAFTYNNLGQFEKAEKLYVVVLEEEKKLFGDNHLKTLSTMHNLAGTYDNLGQVEEAEKLYLVVLEKRQKLLGDDHLDTLQTMHRLAFTYNNLGQFEEAEKLYVIVLEKRKKLLGDDHLDTLKTMHSLAITYDNLGQFEEAGKLKVVVLEKHRNLLGDDHQDTWNAMHNVAASYGNLGQFEKAEQLEVVVLEKRRKVLGDNHQETLRTMTNLVDTYENLGQTEKAEKLKAELLARGQKV